MKNTMELTANRINTLENETRCAIYAPSFGLHVFMGMAALIGGWGMTCFVSGLASIGSLHETGRILITALTGI